MHDTATTQKYFRPLFRQPLFHQSQSRQRIGLGRFMILGQAGRIGTVQMCWNYSSGKLRKHNDPTQ